MTGVVLLVCIAVLIGVAAVLRPSMTGSDDRAETEAALDRVAEIYGTNVQPDMPAGRSWLHGSGRFPEGVNAARSWPMSKWLRDRRGSSSGPIPCDAWGHTIVVLPGTFQGRHVVMIVSAGRDGRLESDPSSGVVGDDLARIIG